MDETYYPRKECFVFGVFENVQFFESQTTKVFHLTLRIVDAFVFDNDIVNKCLVVDVDVVFIEYIDDVYSFFEKGHLILCEGRDELFFLIAYLNSAHLSATPGFSEDIQVMDFGGNSDLLEQLKVLKVTPGFDEVKTC